MSLNYVIVRLLQILPTFFLIMIVCFVLVRLLPGDPTSALLGIKATDADVARANANLGLDQPIPVQFLYFIRNFFRGDLGDSIVLKVSVLSLIVQRLPVTLFLTALAGLFAVILAVPLAVLAALRRDSGVDTAIRTSFQVGLSMPVFYIGIVLLTFFAARLHWFPVGGFGATFGEDIYHLFLPAVTLALSLSAVLMRNLRNSIIEVLTAEYVDFARAKGLRSRLVLFRHVLRNALIPTVALFGLNIGTLLGGAVITETVFAIPGVGRLLIDSIYGRDYPVIQGLTLALALLVSLIFLITDMVQASLDPRIGRR
ncbi:MAG TPA: ABC transporter permease [Candidatus Binatia bacterium]|nr:ABC transporter permease [Candidatus Binatia bacterium]